MSRICGGCGADFSFLDEMETEMQMETKTKTKRMKKRKNRKGKSVTEMRDEDDDETARKMQDPKIRLPLSEYYKKFEETETLYLMGFDVPRPPVGTFLCIFPEVNLEDDELLKQAKFAVDTQNKNAGTKMEFIKIIKAMTQGVGGLLYYLTIVVKDDDGNLKTCQAKIYYSFEETELVLFREAPCN